MLIAQNGGGDMLIATQKSGSDEEGMPGAMRIKGGIGKIRPV